MPACEYSATSGVPRSPTSAACGRLLFSSCGSTTAFDISFDILPFVADQIIHLNILQCIVFDTFTGLLSLGCMNSCRRWDDQPQTEERRSQEQFCIMQAKAQRIVSALKSQFERLEDAEAASQGPERGHARQLLRPVKEAITAACSMSIQSTVTPAAASAHAQGLRQ